MLGFLRKKQEKCYGLSLRNFTDPEERALKFASKEVVFCKEDDRVIDVLARMLSGVRRVPVVGEMGDVKGVVSTSDVLSFIGGGEKSKLFTNTGLSAVVRKIMETDVRSLHATDSISLALEYFKSHGKPVHPVVNESKLHAVVTESDIVNLVSGRTGLTAGQLMSPKPFTAQEDNSVYDVAKMLCRGPYRRLPVVSRGVVIGMVTPFDILSHLNRSEALNSLKDEVSPVVSLMNRNVAHISPGTDIHDAVRVMKTRKVSGLPVVNDDMDIMGMLTKRDIINAMC